LSPSFDFLFFLRIHWSVSGRGFSLPFFGAASPFLLPFFFLPVFFFHFPKLKDSEVDLGRCLRTSFSLQWLFHVRKPCFSPIFLFAYVRSPVVRPRRFCQVSCPLSSPNRHWCFPKPLCPPSPGLLFLTGHVAPWRMHPQGELRDRLYRLRWVIFRFRELIKCQVRLPSPSLRH